MSSFAITFFFKDIFPTYESFEVYLEEELSDFSVNNVNYYLFVYKQLFRRFMNSNIRYDTIEIFKAAFAIQIENVMSQYIRKQKLIKSIHQLTDDEFLEVQEMLNNEAKNPNSVTIDPNKPVSFISYQSYNRVKSGKLKAFMDALYNLPDLETNQLLRNFERFFTVVQFTNINYEFEGGNL